MYSSPSQENLNLQRVCVITLSQLKGRNAQNKYAVYVLNERLGC